MSNPASFHEVYVKLFTEEKSAWLSNWTMYPASAMVPPKFQSSSGLAMGVKSTPVPMDHEPLSGRAGAGLDGKASEPGT